MRDRIYIMGLMIASCVVLVLGLVSTGLELRRYSGKTSSDVATDMRKKSSEKSETEGHSAANYNSDGTEAEEAAAKKAEGEE